MNILAASITQSLEQFINPEDYLIEANFYFEILSFCCGIFIFVIGISRILIYHRIIFKIDLKGKEKFIKKAINYSKKKNQKDFTKVEMFNDEFESVSSFESFVYKTNIDPKSFNIANA